MRTARCRKEGERCTPNSFPSLLCSASLSSKEWPSWAGKTWWGVPQPCRRYTFSPCCCTHCLMPPHPSPSPTPKPCLLTFTSRLNWRRDMVAPVVEARRSTARRTKKELISPEPAAAPHGFLSQVLDTMCACCQAKDKGARYGGCASEEEEVFFTRQKCLPNCSVKQPTSAFPDEHPIRLHSWKILSSSYSNTLRKR